MQFIKQKEFVRPCNGGWSSVQLILISFIQLSFTDFCWSSIYVLYTQQHVPELPGQSLNSSSMLFGPCSTSLQPACQPRILGIRFLLVLQSSLSSWLSCTQFMLSSLSARGRATSLSPCVQPQQRQLSLLEYKLGVGCADNNGSAEF